MMALQRLENSKTSIAWDHSPPAVIDASTLRVRLDVCIVDSKNYRNFWLQS